MFRHNILLCLFALSVINIVINMHFSVRLHAMWTDTFCLHFTSTEKLRESTGTVRPPVKLISPRAPCPLGLFLDRFQQIMHSLLAGRMLLKLRECGKRSVRGDEFKDFGSTFPEQVGELEFRAALVPIDEEDEEDEDTEITPMMLTSDS
jgi:hypothetical protein